MTGPRHLDPDLASLASYDPTRRFYRVLGRQSVPGRWQVGLCVEVRADDRAALRDDALDDRARSLVERHGFDPDGPTKATNVRNVAPGQHATHRYYLEPVNWTPLYGSREEPAVVTAAHDGLRAQFSNDDSPFDSAMAVALAFDDWATRNGHDLFASDVRETHVRGIDRLWEDHARLVVEWMDEPDR